MPFIAPVVLASMIGGGAGIGGALIARNSAGKSQSIAQQQQALSQATFDRSKPAYDAASSYYQNLLSGNPGAMSAAIAPETNATNQLYKGALSSINDSIGARGGYMEKAQRELEGQRFGQLSNLYYGLRPQAANALANLASNNTQASISALNGASQTAYQNSLLQGQASRGIGGILAQILGTPGLFGGGGGSNAPNLGNGPGYPNGSSPFPNVVPPPAMVGGNYPWENS